MDAATFAEILAHDSRDQVVNYVNYWNQRAEVPAKQIVAWLGVGGSKYFNWKKRYGKANEHNGSVPRDHWLEESERKAIVDFHAKNPLEGYRRLTFMMLGAGKRPERCLRAKTEGLRRLTIRRIPSLRDWQECDKSEHWDQAIPNHPFPMHFLD